MALAVAEAIVRGLGFLLTLVLARLLGPADFGPFLLAQTVVLYLCLFQDAGLTMLAQRQLVLGADQGRRTVVTTTVAQGGLGVLVVLVVAVLSGTGLFDPAASRLMLALAPLAVAQALSTLYVLQAHERMVTAALVRIVGQVLAVSGALSLVLATGDVVWAPVAMWAGLLASDVVCWILVRPRLGGPAGRTSAVQVARLLRAGTPFLGATVLYHYVLAVDVVLLGLLSDSESVGSYGAVQRVALTGFGLIQAITPAVYPELVRRSTTAEGTTFLLRCLRAAVRVAWWGAALLMATAPGLTGLLLGSAYSEAWPVLAVLAFLVPVGWHAAILGNALVAAGHPGDFLRGLAISAATATLLLPGAFLWGGTLALAAALVVAVGVQGVAFSAAVVQAYGARAWRVLPLEGLYALPVLAAALVGARLGTGWASVAAAAGGALVATGAIQAWLRGRIRP